MWLPYKDEEYRVDRKAFEAVAKALESGTEHLTFTMIGAIFGQPFWELIALMHPEIKVTITKEK